MAYLLLQLLKSFDGCHVVNPQEFADASISVEVVVVVTMWCSPIVVDSPEHASLTTQSLPCARNTAWQHNSFVSYKYRSRISGKFQLTGKSML